MTALYTTDDGTVVTTHSMMKTFRRCPKMTEYKFVRRLKPKTTALPLKRGSWLHSMLEAHYGGQDPWSVHKHLSHKFSELFDEEKELYGDLPDDTRRIFTSYLWHYENDNWKVHDVEFILETTFPDGSIYRCRIDLLVEDQFGLWLVDHKTHKRLPQHDNRILNSQSALYLWAALRNKIPVRGFIFNYLRTKPPTIPELIKSGKRVSRWDRMDTDYPTASAALKQFGFFTKIKIKPYQAKLQRLKAQQYSPDQPQTSPFFRRDTLEKSTDMIKKVAIAGYRTHQRMHEYFPPPHPDAVERVEDRSCDWCSYKDLCTTELFGGNTVAILKNYEDNDPLSYYDTEEEQSD